MKYFIGIDGGGTKSKCVLTDENLNILHRCEGGPTNYLIIGIDEVISTLFNLIEQCCKSTKIQSNEITAILLGTAGAGRQNDAETLQKIFLQEALNRKITINRFQVESDAKITLEGAFSGKPGSILIAGTGSIMFGKDNDGNIHRVGGAGRLIGDEGSGYSIGRKGLNVLSKYFDGRGPKSKLVNFAKKELSINDQQELIDNIYNKGFDIASFALYVIKSAVRNDIECQRILNEECDELMLHISSMQTLIKRTDFYLCLLGGLLQNKNYYSDLVKKIIELEFPEIKIKSPDHPPDIGAVLMAKHF